jgi:hypothetical protein
MQHTEVDLYKQLTHFCRLLDISRALDTVSSSCLTINSIRVSSNMTDHFDVHLLTNVIVHPSTWLK